MITYTTGEMQSDCTTPYYVTFDQIENIADFINEWVEEHKKEWGTFYVSGKSKYDDYRCDYKYGKIVKSDIPEDKLNLEIKFVNGWGGWGYSSFRIMPAEYDDSQCEVWEV